MRRLIGLGLGWVIAVAGCATPAEPVQGVAREEGLGDLTLALGPGRGAVAPLGPNGSAPVDPPLDLAIAHHPTLWVGQLAPGVSTCPPPSPGFQAPQRLFAGSLALPQELNRYCSYTAVAPGSIGPPADRQLFETLEPDPMAVTFSAGPTLTGIMSDAYAAVFLQQAGRPTVSLGGPSLVRLAVIDSTPTHGVGGAGWTHFGHNGHGYTISNMARSLTCDAASHCLADVTTQLALDLVMGTTGLVTDRVNGGDFGTLGGLAQAIRREVEAWTTGSHPHLVINLSLGWHPDHGGDPAAMILWPAPIRAVHGALVDAACRGALIVAAAGNRMGGPPSSDLGPLYPGGWEIMPLSAADCAARVGGLPSDYAELDGRPLVYAVGGVNEYGDDIGVSRSNARPARVAFSTQGTLLTAGGYAPILSGTSVGTVVVAAAAAAVWQNQPAAGAPEVMGLVTASGAPVAPVEPWFCPGGGCPPAEWINVCEALHQVCDLVRPGTCTRTASPVSCPSTVPADPLPTAPELAAFVATTPRISLDFAASSTSDPSCGFGAMVLRGPTPWPAGDPCPQEQYYDERAQPFVYPQPPHERCPPCYMNLTTGEVYLEWSGRGGFQSLSSLTLTVEDALGSQTAWTTYTLPVGTKLIMYIDPALVAGTVSAWVTGAYAGTSYTSELNMVM